METKFSIFWAHIPVDAIYKKLKFRLQEYLQFSRYYEVRSHTGYRVVSRQSRFRETVDTAAIMTSRIAVLRSWGDLNCSRKIQLSADRYTVTKGHLT